MANKRIKDLATTATTTASGDFIAVDGTTNGTRKLSATAPAFLTSVTTPSLTSPAATPLTLGTTDSGAAITVLAASNNVGIGTTTPGALLHVYSTTDSTNKRLANFEYASAGSLGSGYVTVTAGTRTTDIEQNTGGGGSFRYGTYLDTNIVNNATSSGAYGNINFVTGNTSNSSIVMTIGGGSQKGVVSISNTTAGAANAGALVIAGGISAGNSSVASYFGGAVTVAGTLRATNGNLYTYGESGYATDGILYFNSAASNYIYGSGSQLSFHTANTLRATIASTGATFAGAGAFGGSGSLGSTYLSRLSVFTAGAGNFSVGGQTNTDNTVVARMTAYNASNGNAGNESSANFMGIASIESVVKTATANAGGDSGGDLVFLTKGDGGTLTERMRLLSTGAATFAGAVTVSSTTPTATLTRTSGTDSPRLVYSTSTDSAIIGMSGTAQGLVASSIEGDIVLRTAASRSIRFTVDGGTSSAAVLSSTGATFAGDLSAQRLEAVDAAANNRAAAFIRTQNNTTYSSSVLSIQGDRTTTNGSYNLISAANGTTMQFAVRDSGNVVNANNSYGAISDQKLKENIVDATAKLQKLNQVRIVNFNRIGNGQKQIGVIAQELEQIFPSMIEVAIDRDAEGNDLGTTTKSVKYSVFVPMLIKAVQELTARLAALEAK